MNERTRDKRTMGLGSPALCRLALAGVLLTAGCGVDLPESGGEAAAGDPGVNPAMIRGSGPGAGESLAESGAARLFPDLEAFSALPSSPRRNASSEFWEHWGDGQAELSGYRVTLSRYGEPRDATLSLIYVTEPHDRRTWIKDNAVAEPHRVEVLKLIRSMQFMTGIYPYFVMGTTFAPVDAWMDHRFQPVRINLDVQEWCGSVSHRVLPGAGEVRSLRLSYFEDEGETRSELEVGEGTLYEDALLIQLRELDGPFNGGEAWEGPLVRELWSLRSGHREVHAVPATITRSDARRGDVAVTRFRLDTGDYWRTYDIEKSAPRRVLGWETSTGEIAEILQTERLPYWTLNGSGDERYRRSLGLDQG